MAVKNVKICPYCHSLDTKRNSISDGVQRYKCKIRFRLRRRLKKLQKVILNQYIYKRQTLSDLAYRYKKSILWIQNKYTWLDYF